MILSVKYNGYELSEYFIVNDLRRGIGTNRTNSLQKMGQSRGVKYLGYTKDENFIEMDITILNNVLDKRRLLGGILDASVPTELIIGDEPDKYYLAVIDSKVDIDEIIRHGKGTITWLIPDGVAYAKNSKTFVASQSNGVMQVEIDNQGTDDCPVVIQADFTSDNGLFAAVSPYNVIEVGNREEVDGHVFQQTDVVARNSFTASDEQNWQLNSADARTTYPTAVSGLPNRFGEGSFTWAQGVEWATPVFPANNTECWVGPTLYRTFAANSNNSRTGNFEALWRCDFSSGALNQSGRQEFTLQSGDNVVLTAILRDSSHTKREMIAEFVLRAPDGQKYSHNQTIPLAQVKSSWFDVRVTRIGNKLTFSVSNVKTLGGSDNVATSHFTFTRSFIDDNLADVPITAAMYWPHARWNNTPPLDLMRPTNFVFRWINVDKWADDPNRYSAGDQMIIDSRVGKTFLNGVPILNDVVKGSTYITVPPGKTILQFVVSNFASPPNVTATIQEVFL